MKSFVLAAAAALALGAAPALAQPIKTEGDTARLAVSYADLNLQSAGGQAVLTQRIRHAAEMVCGPTPDQRDVKAFLAFERCMKQSTDTAIAAIPTASQLAGVNTPAG